MGSDFRSAFNAFFRHFFLNFKCCLKSKLKITIAYFTFLFTHYDETIGKYSRYLKAYKTKFDADKIVYLY